MQLKDVSYVILATNNVHGCNIRFAKLFMDVIFAVNDIH